MDLQTVIPTLMFGLSSSAVYFFLAGGMALCFGLMRIISLDQFLYYTVGGYMTYTLVTLTGSFWLGLLAGIIVSCILAVFVERFIFRRIYEKPVTFSLITSFAVFLTSVGVVKYIWGLNPRPVGTPFHGNLSILGASLPYYRIFLIIAAAVVYIGLWMFLNKSIIGKAIRAGIEDAEKVEALGINIYKLFTITFIIAAGLSAMAGNLHAPIVMVGPNMGWAVIPFAFMIVIIGGLGSLKGTLISALIIGQVVNFGTVIWAPLATVAPFTIMILVLIFKPTGLYGSKIITKG